MILPAVKLTCILAGSETYYMYSCSSYVLAAVLAAGRNS